MVESGLAAMTVPSLLEQLGAAKATEKQMYTLADRMAHYGVAGVSMAVIEDGEIAWAKGYGLANAELGDSVTTRTCFEAGSTSKLLASLAVLSLCEQGLLELDVDVDTQLESWHFPESEFTRDRKVTLRRLLTHSAGVNRPDGGFSEEPGIAPSLQQVLSGLPPALNQPAVVEFEPGSGHQYSNMGYLVIQQLIEETTGKPYPAVAQEFIFEPLNLRQSTFVHPLTPAFKDHLAPPHDEKGIPHVRPQSPHALAQGGLVTTPTDLALLAIAMIQAQDGAAEEFLSANTVRKMLTEQVALDPGRFFGMTQGLGVFLVGEGESLYFIHPGQNSPGATCLLIASPVTRQGLVVMTNGASGLMLSLEILRAVANVYQWPTV